MTTKTKKSTAKVDTTQAKATKPATPTTAERSLLTAILKADEAYSGNVKHFASELAKANPDIRFSNVTKAGRNYQGGLVASTTHKYKDKEYRVNGIIMDRAIGQRYGQKKGSRELALYFQHGNIVGDTTVNRYSAYSYYIDTTHEYPETGEANVDVQAIYIDFLNKATKNIADVIAKKDAYKKRKEQEKKAAIEKKARIRDAVFKDIPELVNFKKADAIFEEAYRRSQWESKVKEFVQLVIDLSERA